MAKAIMVQGTTSNAGKSFLTAGLCRIFREDGYKVAPFKSQNMALNSFITREGLEMGRAQVMQAEAAGVEPSVLMNPILLKPSSDTGSQVIVNGEVLGNMSAREYFRFKSQLIPRIKEAYEALAAQYDVIVIEGAGSPAEINLKQEDLVNMGMAKMANAPVLLAGDIDRGGVFASLAGTLMLLEPEERAMVKGLVINKFRGDVEILRPGLSMLEELTGVPVTGVVPYLQVTLDDEDSLSGRLENHTLPGEIDIAVLRLPRLSNFTDFNPLEYIPGVSVRYVSAVSQFGSPDLVILPGTKNTMEDLLWLRQSGLEMVVRKHAAGGGAVFGICGGYQMLGESLRDPYGVEHGGEMAGIGLLPMHTVFTKEKVRTRVSGKFCTIGGILQPLSQTPFEGYEIHMGTPETQEDPLGHPQKDLTELTEISGKPAKQTEGLWAGNVYGTYIHGIFDREEVAKAVISALCTAKGISMGAVDGVDMGAFKEKQYSLLATSLRKSLNMEAVYHILNHGI